MKSEEWRVESEVLGAQEPIKEGDCSGADPLSRHEVRDGVSGDVREIFCFSCRTIPLRVSKYGGANQAPAA